MALQFEKITEQIIGAAFEVHGVLGYGFLEKVYQRAMQAELIRRGLKSEIEHKITVCYKNVEVGNYQADSFCCRVRDRGVKSRQDVSISGRTATSQRT